MSDDLFHFFCKFGIGHLLSRLSLEKQDGVSASELILSLCLFRILGKSIHSICKHKIYELSNHGKNCFYRMMIRPQMDWRRLMNHFALRYMCLLRKYGKVPLSTKYTVLGRKKNAAELIATYERERGKNCRKYKCRYIQLNGNLGDIPVRIFLIKYGRNSTWNILLTTDTTMSFIKAFEVYQIRWNIEVMNKETKQYLGLGSYQGCDFNGQIADATLCYLTYTVMALEKRFTEYQTLGELFSGMEGDLMALTLWKRVLACIERILRILGEVLGMTPQHLMATISGNDKEMSKILVMAEALKKWDEVYGQTT